MSAVTKDARQRQRLFSCWEKLTFFGIFLAACFAWLYFHYTTTPTKPYDLLDEASFKQFKENTTFEVSNAIDRNLDQFIAEITSGNTMLLAISDFFRSTESQKEQRITELWQKHMDNDINSAITSRVKLLVEDMYEHNEECMRDLHQSGVDVQGFERKIRDDFLNKMKAQGISISSGGVNDSIMGLAVATGIGFTAEAGAALLMSNPLTFVVGLIAEELISNKWDEGVRQDLGNKIHSALFKALNSNDGLYVNIKRAMDQFHAERAELIRKAEDSLYGKDRRWQRFKKDILDICSYLKELYSSVKRIWS